MQHDSEPIEHPRATLQNYYCPKCKYDLVGCDPKGNCPECGMPVMSGCIVCAYDLSGTDLESNCPECGTPVYCSVGRGALNSIPTKQLKSVHLGFRLVTNLILLYIVSVIVTMVGLFYIIGVNPDQYYPLAAIAAIINNGIIFGMTSTAGSASLSACRTSPMRSIAPISGASSALHCGSSRVQP